MNGMRQILPVKKIDLMRGDSGSSDQKNLEKTEEVRLSYPPT